MILSNKNYVQIKTIEITSAREIEKKHYISHFLLSTLSTQEAITIVASLIIFQFSLYDFNIHEYIGNNLGFIL